MQFKRCVICGLNLPSNYLVPIFVRHQSKVVRVLICKNCKAKKEAEAKRRQ